MMKRIIKFIFKKILNATWFLYKFSEKQFSDLNKIIKVKTDDC